MKTDLLSSIGIAIAGTLIAYFVCNLFFGEIESYKVKTVDSTISTDLAEPNPEVYNYKALDPTVEVYVGDCEGDECNEASSEEIIDIGVDTDSNDGSNSGNNNSNTPSNQGNNNTQRNP